MKLYRGYIADTSRNLTPRTRSTINIAEEIKKDPNFNPNDRDHTDKINWVTPDKYYAWYVAFSRYVAAAVFDSDARRSILKGDLVPALAVYEVSGEQGLFNVSDENKVTPFTGKTDQMIIQDIGVEGVSKQQITPESRENLLRKIFDPSEDEDRIIRVGRAFELITGKELPFHRYHELKGKSFADGIYFYFDYCWGDFDEDKLPKTEDIVDITARAIFTRTVGMADDYEFRPPKRGEVYKPFVVSKEKTSSSVESGETRVL